MKEIKITCKGQKYIPIDKLKNFQGNLKELREEQFEKLKNLILKYGFSFPVFVWDKYLLDGHQRIYVLKKLIKQGYTIGDIPVIEIQAKDKKEAAEKLLALNSKFGDITSEGLYEFINANDVDVKELSENFEIPDIDIDKFLEGYYEDATDDNEDSERKQNQEDKMATCPKCGARFTI